MPEYAVCVRYLVADGRQQSVETRGEENTPSK